jgi:hypothetical protein
MAAAPKTLKARIDALGVSQDALAAVANVHTPEVSRYVRGFHVSEARRKAIEATLLAIEELVKFPSSLVPNMRKPESIRAALANLKKQKVEMADAESQAASTSFAVLSVPDPTRTFVKGAKPSQDYLTE